MLSVGMMLTVLQAVSPPVSADTAAATMLFLVRWGSLPARW